MPLKVKPPFIVPLKRHPVQIYDAFRDQHPATPEIAGCIRERGAAVRTGEGEAAKRRGKRSHSCGVLLITSNSELENCPVRESHGRKRQTQSPRLTGRRERCRIAGCSDNVCRAQPDGAAYRKRLACCVENQSGIHIAKVAVGCVNAVVAAGDVAAGRRCARRIESETGDVPRPSITNADCVGIVQSSRRWPRCR